MFEIADDLANQIFEGDRIYIRLLKAADISDEILNSFEDDTLMKYYTNSKNKITKENLIQSLHEGVKNRNNYTFGIFYKENNLIIGTLKLGLINWHHKISDLVVLISNKNYHGKGLAVEAIEVGNKIAFEYFDLRKLTGGMYEENISSIKAYTRAGWVQEGRLIGHYLENGKAMDRILVSCFNPKYFK